MNNNLLLSIATITIALLSGCGLPIPSILPTAAPTAKSSSSVEVIYAQGERRILIVRPPKISQHCLQLVKDTNKQYVDCQTEYIVFCEPKETNKLSLCEIAKEPLNLDRFGIRESFYPHDIDDFEINKKIIQDHKIISDGINGLSNSDMLQKDRGKGLWMIREVNNPDPYAIEIVYCSSENYFGHCHIGVIWSRSGLNSFGTP